MGIVEDIERVSEMLAKPYPRAIWFVDCQQVYTSFMACLRERKWKPNPLNPFSVPFMGPPVYEWYTECEREGDTKPDLPFLSPGHRGVWVEMNDGNHQHFIYYHGLLFTHKDGLRCHPYFNNGAIA